jgi:hypothetical protein
MNDDRRQRMLAAALAAALSVVGAGCATQPDVLQTEGLSVQKSADSHFEINRVRVYRDGGALSVSGDVANLMPQRILTPGRVEISVIGPDGSTLVEEITTPMRKNAQARSAHFYARLPVTPPTGSTLRISHHLD